MKLFSISIKKENQRFFCLLFLQIAFTLLILLFCDIKYEVSDDFVMSLIASGAFNGFPSPYIMFSNVIYGTLLSGLYRLFSSVNWYFWLQITVSFLSVSAISYLISQKFCTALSILIFCIFYLFCAQDLFVLIQFTKTASAAICSGSILFLWGIFYAKSKRCSIAGSLLVLIGSMIRFNCIYMAAPFVLLCLIIEGKRARVLHQVHVNHGRIDRRDLSHFAACLLLILAVFSFHGVNLLSYRLHEDTSYFKEYSYVRANIVDYERPDYESCQEELTAIGISKNDYELLDSWNFSDPTVFSLSKMKELLTVIQSHRNTTLSPISILKKIKDRGCIHYYITSCCILLGLLNVVLNKKHRFAVPFFCAACVLGLLSYFIFIGRCIYRIEFGCFLGAACVMLFYLKSESSSKTCMHPNFKKGTSILCLVASAVLCLTKLSDYRPDRSYVSLSDSEYRNYVNATLLYDWDYNADKYTRSVNKRTQRAEFLTELKTHPDNLYLLDFSTVIQTLYFDFSPFDAILPGSFSNALYLGGVTIHHPSVDEAFASRGITNPMLALLSDSVYLVSNTNADRLATFLEEHYQICVQIQLYKTTDDYQIWKLSKKD